MIVTTYAQGDTVPKAVQASLRMMGLQSDMGHMRLVAAEAFSAEPFHFANKTEMFHAFVASENGKVLGWACTYRIEGDLCCSIWVGTRHRHKGVGTLIMKEVFKEYEHEEPVLFGNGKRLWAKVWANRLMDN